MRRCVPAVCASLGFWSDEYGTQTKLHSEHQAWRYVKHIDKVLGMFYDMY